jgi:hypothetical protein
MFAVEFNTRGITSVRIGRDQEQPATGLADAMYDVVAAQPNEARNTALQDTADDLVAAERLIEIPGRGTAIGYRAVVTAFLADCGDLRCVGAHPVKHQVD